jgi:hypothetical protein
MTSVKRFKRSCGYATGAVLASAVMALVAAHFENRANSSTSDAIELPIQLIGIPLAPGWLLLSGVFEKLRPAQFSGVAVLIPLISVGFDTVFGFGFWEFFHKMSRRSD